MCIRDRESTSPATAISGAVTPSRNSNDRNIWMLVTSEVLRVTRLAVPNRDVYKRQAQTSGELDNLLSQLGGKPGAVQTLEKLEQAEKTAEDKLAALLEQLRGAPQDLSLIHI